ncbi:hypothetical protein [Streptomyces sp. DSM 118878]
MLLRQCGVGAVPFGSDALAGLVGFTQQLLAVVCVILDAGGGIGGAFLRGKEIMFPGGVKA